MQAQTNSEKLYVFLHFFSGWWITPAGLWEQRKMGGRWRGGCTDKKEIQIFLIDKEIQNRAVAKSYMRKVWGLRVLYNYVDMV